MSTKVLWLKVKFFFSVVTKTSQNVYFKNLLSRPIRWRFFFLPCVNLLLD